MICLGVGFSQQADCAAIVAAIKACLRFHQLSATDLQALATVAAKDSPPLRQAAQALALPLTFPAPAALDHAAKRCLSPSPRVLAAHGLPSVAEAAALAAVGDAASLLGPKRSLGAVSCALAHDGRQP